MTQRTISVDLGGGDESLVITVKGSAQRIDAAMATVQLDLRRELSRLRAEESAGAPPEPCQGCGH
jgi:hypothetical protein